MKQFLFFSFTILYCTNIAAMELTQNKQKQRNDIERIDHDFFLRHGNWDSLSINPNAKRVYKKITTPFLVKNNNDTVYVQDDVANITLLNIYSGKKIEKEEIGTSFIRTCIKSRDHNLLITGDSEGIINVLPIDNDLKLKKQAHSFGAVVCLATEKDRLCSAALDGTIKIWHISENGLKSMMPQYRDFTVNSLLSDKPACAHSLMLRNNLLYAGLSFGQIRILDIRTEDKRSTLLAHIERVSCLMGCKNDDSTFYSGSFDGDIKKWDLRNLKACLNVFAQQEYGITCMYESNNGNTLISGGADGLRIWDVKNSKTASSYIAAMQSPLFVDDIAVNNTETELYVATVPHGIVVLGLE